MTKRPTQISANEPLSSEHRWSEVERLFEVALQLDSTKRSAFIEEACKDDPELRAEVESLIEHDTQAEATFLQPPIAPLRAVASSEDDEPDPLIGQHVGKYLIQRVIGTGGMGTVYEAMQEKPRRIVALKVARSGFTSGKTLRRFESESEILARLHHPNIAQIHEAGVHRLSDGTKLAFFAMEYVERACSITEFSDQEELGTEARLRLFMQACDAVQHGHQMGIIHRDLKPANILIERLSSPQQTATLDGRVKIIDFGVARSTDSDVAVTTMHTNVGQLIGTLQYMSPEQCDADPLGVDTRSDVYSLGVILFELLTGELPYDATRTTVYEATRIIKEQQPQHLSTIRPKLRGDVDTIALKALEKDREKRYASAAALAEDIGRFLRSEPIDARVPTLWTRYLKWVARHPVASTASLALFVAMLIIALLPSIAFWYGSGKPRDVIVSEDHRSATVISIVGTNLHTWQGDVSSEIGAARLVRHGSQPLAIVAFSQSWPNDFAGKLCAFDAGGPYDEAVWCSELTDDQIPPTKRDGFSPQDYWPQSFEVFDVFHETAGPEMVVTFVNLYSLRLIRIYAFDGSLLFQTWHDGVASSAHWMSKAGLLVLAGTNDECYWKDRGYPSIERPTPIVVFAIRPRLGKISNKLLDVYCRDGDDCPVWYRYLSPIHLNDTLGLGTVRAPEYQRFDAGEHVQLSFLRVLDSDTSISWILDALGNIVSPAPLTTDAFNLLENPPDLSDFALRDFNELQRCEIGEKSAESAIP